MGLRGTWPQMSGQPELPLEGGVKPRATGEARKYRWRHARPEAQGGDQLGVPRLATSRLTF